MVAPKKKKETTEMTTPKKILTVALAAVALTTASLAATGSAQAHWKHRHGHGFWGVGFSSVIVDSGCYTRWVRGVGRVMFCG